jgi:hypothetical protein
MVEWIITVVGRAGAVIDASRARMECIHPLRSDFGSIAVIAPVLRQSLEAGSYSAATAQRFGASPSLAHTSTSASARAFTSASLW